MFAVSSIPEVADPLNVPMTFMEQERAMVLKHLKLCQLEEEATVLHLGCRDGSFTKELAKYLPQGQLVGFENRYINSPIPDHSNVIFLQGNLRDQKWEDRFDCIICTQFEECGEDSDYCIPMIEKALKPGGFAIILQCTEIALPAANPLKEWLRQPEAEGCVKYLTFWSPIYFAKFRSLITNNYQLSRGFSDMPRMVACFKDENAFKEDAKKWFRKMSDLTPEEQQKCLEQAFRTMREKKLSVKSETGFLDVYYFIYNLEVGYFRKEYPPTP